MPDAVLFAATYPQRVAGLVLGEVTAKARRDPESDAWGLDRAVIDQLANFIETSWGNGDFLHVLAPSASHDARVMAWWRRYERNSATPNTAAALLREMLDVDIRDVLPAVRAPTLVIHRRDAPVLSPDGARWLAEQIPGGRYVELPGVDTLPFFGDMDGLMDEIRQFLTGVPGSVQEHRVLATVVVIDIVDSTGRAERLGDVAWRDLLDAYRHEVRRLIPRFDGHEVDNAGDGFLITFDRPARAVRAAQAACEAVRLLGLEIRAGVHTGEVELRDGSVSGIAVHVCARVAALAEPGAVYTTTTVRDLVLGSNLVFSPRGSHALKGVQGEWPLFCVSN